MNSYCTSPWIVLLVICSIFVICSILTIANGQSNKFIVTAFGGAGDGKTDNKQAFLNAWMKACGTVGGAVYVPVGKFFVSSGEFNGPCKGKTLFHIDGTVVADDSTGSDSWLTFNHVDGLTLDGNGAIDGNGQSAWSHCADAHKCDFNRPIALRLNFVTNSLIQNIRLVNSKVFHMNILASQNINVVKVTILAPENSPNTDGIHIGRSSGINITDSYIGTGDDCISIGDGSNTVHISGVICGPGHGISIGSLGRYKGEEDVRGIRVKNCTLSKTQNGLRIKTWAIGVASIVVSDVTYEDIILNNVKNPIFIDQYYCPTGKGRCGRGESNVQVTGVTYSGVRGTSSVVTAVDIQCSKMKPCKNIKLSGVDITYNGKPTNASCSNEDVVFTGIGQIPSTCT